MNPNSLDRGERVHLEWMFENQPEFVRQLHESNELRPHLERKNQQALRLVDLLKQEQGLSEDEAFEVAISSVLSPADGPAMSDNPPEPVPWQEQEQIYQRLEQ